MPGSLVHFSLIPVDDSLRMQGISDEGILFKLSGYFQGLLGIFVGSSRAVGFVEPGQLLQKVSEAWTKRGLLNGVEQLAFTGCVLAVQCLGSAKQQSEY